MPLAYRFRLYPTKKQQRRMAEMVEGCRVLWNVALEDRKGAWKCLKERTTYGQQAAMLVEEAKTDDRFSLLYSQSGQDVLRRLDKAFKGFFKGNGYPKFKKYSGAGSFTYPQAYNGSVKLLAEEKRIHLSKVGRLRMVLHRDVPNERMKTCTVVHEPDGRWYCSLTFEEVVPLQNVKMPEEWEAPVGIDRGLISLVATSDGKKIDAPKLLRKSEARLKQLQQKLSRNEKGSKNRAKARVLVARHHSHIVNQRKDFNHKVSFELAEEHDLVAFEDLSIGNMLKNHSLAKSITDAGWGQLSRFTEYKMARRGKAFVSVEAAYSTMECWFCGARNPVQLDVRQFECSGCGKVLDRDVNAARIVLKRGIAKVGQDRSLNSSRLGGESHRQAVPELKPVETGVQPTEAQPASEAGTTCSQELEAHDFSRGRMSRCTSSNHRRGLRRVASQNVVASRRSTSCLPCGSL